MTRNVLEVPLSKVSPAYLHSNSTSHTWVFSAIAELIDNAYDPDVSATELWIDRARIGGKQCLTIEDNGRGMDHNHLLLMLSFGYCEKGELEARRHKPIGKYGNGFKSGSMRLGKDALVFTVCDSSASVGFLSQTYLLETKADCVRVPMIEYSLPQLEFVSPSAESRAMLDTIFEFSPYTEENDIKKEFEQLRTRQKKGTGTKIVLFNLKRHKNSLLELDFDSDPQDIRNPEVHEVDTSTEWSQETQNETSEYVSSLRHYCSILYLRPRMKIYIRGVKVKTMLISESLSHTGKDNYKPPWLEKPLGITFGFFPCKSSKITDEFGVMFYHRNRLIKAFEKVGYQKQPNELGVGVVGVVHDADFLTPTHNKQDFIKDEKYNSLLGALGRKLNRYWDAKKGQSGSGERFSTEVADWNWANCDKCNKWRRLPESMCGVELPDKWYCHMNRDPAHNRCEIQEESHLEGEFICTSPKVKPVSTQKRKSKCMEELEAKKAEVEAKAAELAARVAELEETERKRRKMEPSPPPSLSPSPKDATPGKHISAGRKGSKSKLSVQFPGMKKFVVIQDRRVPTVKVSSVPAMTTGSNVSSAGIRFNPPDLRTSGQPLDTRGGTSGQGQVSSVQGTGSTYAAVNANSGQLMSPGAAVTTTTNANSGQLMSVLGAAVTSTTCTSGVPTSLQARTSTVAHSTTTGDVSASLSLPAASCQTSDQLKTNAKLISHILSSLPKHAGIGALTSVSAMQTIIPASDTVGLSLQARNAVLNPVCVQPSELATGRVGGCTSGLRSSASSEHGLSGAAPHPTHVVHVRGRDTNQNSIPQAAHDRDDVELYNVLEPVDVSGGRQAGLNEWENKYALLQEQYKKLAEEKEKLFQVNKEMAEEREKCIQANKKIAEEKKKLFQANNKMVEEKEEHIQAMKKLAEEKEKLCEANKTLAEEKEEHIQANKKIAEEKEKLFQVNKKMVEEKEEHIQAMKKLAEEKEKLFEANKKMAEEKEEHIQANKKIDEEKKKLFLAIAKTTEEKQEAVQEKKKIEEQKEETERRFWAIERQFISLRRDIHRLLNHTIPGFSCVEEEVEQAVKDIIEENCV